MTKELGTNLSNTQRSQIVWAILNRTRYDNDAPEKVGIQRLVGKNIYTAAFPLHDGDYEKQDDKPDKKNERRVSLDIEFKRVILLKKNDGKLK